jgi:putative ABC transport system ATP-binding protein
MILKVEAVSKSFQSGGHVLDVLKEVDLSLEAGSTCAIMGPSGSGKTTLLGLCAGLDRPTSGEVVLNDQSLPQLSEDALARLRLEHTGFIFQSFRLLPSLTAIENVMVPAELLGAAQPRQRARELLAEVGLGDRTHHYPTQLSGGEQQRVAIARAFINQPRIIFADEPTGNLDEETGAHVLDLLFSLNRELGTTLLLVTHDMALTERVQRIVTIKGGRIVSNQRNTPR